MRFTTLVTGSALFLSYGVFAATISQNARCGKDFGGFVCPERSTSVGSCCSQYGWCGRTENHCNVSKGCQSSFGSCSPSSVSSIKTPVSTPSPVSSNLKTSTNGKCGVVSSQTCLNSVFGNCCSQHGYCGSSNAYCGSGCQTKFGSCKDAPATPSSSLASPSSATSKPVVSAPATAQSVSTNARCGAAFGGRTCKGSKWGNCCSQYSYCGSTDAYCAPETCQKGFGDCKAVFSSGIALSTTQNSVSSTVVASSVFSTPSSSLADVLSTSYSSAELSSATTSSSSDPVVTPETVSSSPSSSAVTSLDPSSSSTSSEMTSSASASPTSLSSASPSPTPSPTSEPTPEPTPPAPTQLLINPGFEDPTTSPWILFPAGTGTSIAALSDAQYGLKSVRVTRTPSLFASVRQVVAISAAGTYTASFSVKVDGTVGVPCFISVTGHIEKEFGYVEAQEWTRFSETAVLGVQSDYVRVVVSCSWSVQTGSVWFDDVTLTRVG